MCVFICADVSTFYTFILYLVPYVYTYCTIVYVVFLSMDGTLCIIRHF